MKVKTARTAGFCMGVQRALDIVLEGAKRHGRIWTLGPLIHNNQALEVLASRGVRTAEDLSQVDGGSVVIRAHGAGPTVRSAIRSRGLEIIDATCPRVLRCQRAVERAVKAGRNVVIIGDRSHAEVEALLDVAAHGGAAATVVSSEADVEQATFSPPITIVGQTTFSPSMYEKLASEISKKIAGKADIEIVQSLCTSTEERYEEVQQLAKEVDAVVVVGGRHSANTKRLAELAQASGRPTFHVETADELDEAELARFSTVGVTAGASTPAWVTERVVEKLLSIASPWRRSLYRFLSVLAGTNLLLATSAAALADVATRSAGVSVGYELLFVTFAYVFFAHAVNRAGEDSLPEPAAGPGVIFHTHRVTILTVAAVLSLVALGMVFRLSAYAALALIGAQVLALIYGLPIFSRGGGPMRLVRLRDIPASKDLAVALGWAFAAVVVPLLAAGWECASWAHALYAALCVFALGFSGATCKSLGDVHSDRLTGRETLAVALGRAPARLVGALMAGAVAAVSFSLLAVGFVPPEAAGLGVSGLGVFILILRRRRPGDSLFVASWIDASLLASWPASKAAHLLAQALKSLSHTHFPMDALARWGL